jgi:regulatory protein
MSRDSAKERAMGYLRYGDRTIAEIRTYLEKKGFEQTEIDEAVAYLSESGLIDDERYGRRYAELGAEKRKSPQKIAMELTQKGLAKDRVKVWLDECLTAEVIFANALAEARKYKEQRELGTSRADVERIKKRLAYLGYEPNVLHKAAVSLQKGD